jgi:lipoyl-dependent peroxiredoxin subunit C
MALLVSKKAPQFTAQALVGRESTEISLADYAGKWVVLFFYPRDFSPWCPWEIKAFNERLDEFSERNAVVLGGSTDAIETHLRFVESDEAYSNLQYPLFSDTDKTMSASYGVLLEEPGIALRGTFVIDPEGILRWMSVNDFTLGRNIDDLLRVIDAQKTGEFCPVGWQKGQPTIGR